MQRFWIRLFLFAQKQIKWKETSFCGARSIFKGIFSHYQVDVIFWDMRLYNWRYSYSKEELVEMFDVIRRCEKLQGWKVPELKLL